jgi:hypothetical protein
LRAQGALIDLEALQDMPAPSLIVAVDDGPTQRAMTRETSPL